MATLSEITDILDRSGERHSNTKVIALVVIMAELVLVYLTRILKLGDFGSGEVVVLLSLLAASFGQRLLMAFWKIRGANGGNNVPK